MNAFCKINMIKEGKSDSVEVVSIGITADNGQEFYGEFTDFRIYDNHSAIIDTDGEPYDQPYKCLRTAIRHAGDIQEIRNALTMTGLDFLNSKVAYTCTSYPVKNSKAYTFHIRGKKHQIEFELGSWLNRLRELNQDGITLYMNDEDIEVFKLLMWTWNARLARLNILTKDVKNYMNYLDAVNLDASEEYGWNALNESRFIRSAVNIWLKKNLGEEPASQLLSQCANGQ